jgi:uncharacterized caspase-like protein
MKTTFKIILLLLLLTTMTFAQKATTYAIIIGVADYQSINDLTYTTTDAQKVYAFLTSQAGGAVPSNHIRFLTNSKATKANILKEMKYIFGFAKPQDRVVFYFSGHGDTGLFCPHDFQGNKANALMHDDIKDIFKGCKARTKLCIADACRSGSIKGGDTRAAKPQQGLEDKSAGVAVIMASKASQAALENNYLKQGFFTYYLIQGLSGKSDNNRDKIITIKELFTYVSKNVKRESKGKQVPIMFSNTFTMPVAYL